MGRNQAVSNTTLILNGHTFTGWSEDADALSMPTVDLAVITRGGDGRLTASDTGNRGGPVIVKLQPTSESAKFLMNSISTARTGGRIKWNGYARYNDTNVTVALTTGVLVNGPLGPTVGKGASAPLVFTFEFEDIIPDYTTADFS